VIKKKKKPAIKNPDKKIPEGDVYNPTSPSHDPFRRKDPAPDIDEKKPPPSEKKPKIKEPLNDKVKQLT